MQLIYRDSFPLKEKTQSNVIVVSQADLSSSNLVCISPEVPGLPTKNKIICRRCNLARNCIPEKRKNINISHEAWRRFPSRGFPGKHKQHWPFRPTWHTHACTHSTEMHVQMFKNSEIRYTLLCNHAFKKWSFTSIHPEGKKNNCKEPWQQLWPLTGIFRIWGNPCLSIKFL